MSKNHLDNHCISIPAETRRELLKLKDSKRRAGGGKAYWADSAEALGIFEDQYGLRFSKEAPDLAKDAGYNENAKERLTSKEDTTEDPTSTSKDIIMGEDIPLEAKSPN